MNRRIAPGTGDEGDPDERGVRVAGRYRLGDVIGRGGMAEVVDGFDEALQRAVAVKRLRPEYAHDPDVRRRFTREAQAGARLHHPNVVAIYDVGGHDGMPFLVMERLPGRTLHDELLAGPRSADGIRELAADMLGAIGAAHRVGILHRDIKPANVLLDEHGRAKVGDFGIAVVRDDVHHTSTGLVLGTLSYLAPERLAGAPATPAADLYAAGVVLFEAATGRPAFRADSPLALTRAVAEEVPAFSEEDRRRLDPHFVAGVRRAMAKDPLARFESAEEMLAAISIGPFTGDDAPPTQPVSTDPSPTRRLPVPSSRATVRDDRSTPNDGVGPTSPRDRRQQQHRLRAGLLALVVALGGAGVAAAVATRSDPPPTGSTATSSKTPQPGPVPGPLGPALDAIDRAIDR